VHSSSIAETKNCYEAICLLGPVGSGVLIVSLLTWHEDGEPIGLAYGISALIPGDGEVENRPLAGVLDMPHDRLDHSQAEGVPLSGVSSTVAGLGPNEDATGLRAAPVRGLVIELLALQVELACLELKQFTMLARDFLLVCDLLLDGADCSRLLAEGKVRQNGRGDGEYG
jgi:hypothetical protein